MLLLFLLVAVILFDLIVMPSFGTNASKSFPTVKMPVPPPAATSAGDVPK